MIVGEINVQTPLCCEWFLTVVYQEIHWVGSSHKIANTTEHGKWFQKDEQVLFSML